MFNKGKRKTWDEYQKVVPAKKKPDGDQKRGKKTPECILVQRMSSEPNEKKRYEGMGIREFVDFSEYTRLTIENVRNACEKHFNTPPGSCDMLLSDKGPSCFATFKIVGWKCFSVRFITKPLFNI